MDHPNIAKVFDGGATESGRPYFVMELVKGVPITKYCDEHRLMLRQRLELFVPVCQAVQHAHQKGVIHRDLKPSNVLVALYDGRPVPKVIDFGVAKATGQKLTDKTLFTDFGAVVGTLEYMSPEQAELNQLDIDTRSDVYALGIVLYELLTGTTPLERKRLREVALLECLRIIREEEPPKPSTRLSTTEQLPLIAAKRGLEPKKLSGQIRGDLDWMAMKCLEKDRNRRYETANGLAMDVQRYLADEAVLASPPSAWYQLRKFARRHKAGLWTTAAASLILAVATVGVCWALWDQSRQRAELASRMSDTEKTVTAALVKAGLSADRAGRQRSSTSEEARAALVDWREAMAGVAEADAALSTGAATDGLRERLADLRHLIRSGTDREQRMEKLFRELDNARMASADWEQSSFNHAKSAAEYADALVGYGLEIKPWVTEQLAGHIRAEDPAIRAALLVALDDWALQAFHARTSPSASELRALATATDDDPWRQQVRDAAAAQDWPKLKNISVEARTMQLPASSLNMLATLLMDAGKDTDAIALLRWARVEYPDDFWILFWRGVLSLNKGHQQPTPLELQEAVGCFEAALALRPRATAAHINVGLALDAKMRPDDAMAEYKKAIKLDPKMWEGYHNLGSVLQGKNQFDDAIAEYHKALALDPKKAIIFYSLGNALFSKNQFDDAIEEYQKAIALEPERPVVHYGLAQALRAKNRLDDAIAEYKKAINLEPKLPNRALAEAHNGLGNALQDRNQLDDAITEYKKAIAIDDKRANAHKGLGNALQDKNQLDDAITEYKKAIAIDPKNLKAHYGCGRALQLKNQLDDAIVEYRIVLDLEADNAEAHCN